MPGQAHSRPEPGGQTRRQSAPPHGRAVTLPQRERQHGVSAEASGGGAGMGLRAECRRGEDTQQTGRGRLAQAAFASSRS